jgi:L-lysine 2,3-aminomutase
VLDPYYIFHITVNRKGMKMFMLTTDYQYPVVSGICAVMSGSLFAF